MSYRLYYSPGSASLLVHWLLIELELPHELVPVDLAAKAQTSPDYLRLNPNGVVPTLVVDGQPRHEAAALALLLADRHPQSGLAPTPGDPRRDDLLQWMFNLSNMVQPLLRQWWYPHEPAGEAHADEVLKHCAARLESQWARIDAHLAHSGPYLLGESPSVADFYLAMLARWARQTPRPATDWPHLANLVGTLAARPSFATLQQREGLSGWP